MYFSVFSVGTLDFLQEELNLDLEILYFMEYLLEKHPRMEIGTQRWPALWLF